MDKLFLKLVDRVGDYLQEKRGIDIPRILYAIEYISTVAEIIWIATFTIVIVMGDNMYLLPMLLIILPIFGYTLRKVPKRLSGYQADFDRTDEEKVMRKYQSNAIVMREMFAGLRTAIFFLCAAMVFMNSILIVSEGAKINYTAPLIYFLVIIFKNYGECIIPKIPRVERELKLAEARIG